MIDIRYHSVSLVAVFMMLGVGIIIGLNLASPAQKQQTKALKSLQERVEGAVQDGQEAKRRLLHIEHAVDILRARVVPGKLANKRVEIIVCGDYPAAAHSAATALSDAGAISVAQIVITDKFVGLSSDDRADLYGRLGSQPPSAPPASNISQAELMNPLMSALHDGSPPGSASEEEVSTLENGRYIDVTGEINQPCSLFVIIGGRNDDGNPTADNVAETETALIEGLLHTGYDLSVVGCEPSDALVSSIPNYQREQKIATVDCIDQPLGQLDLPFALRGGVDKADYGLKSTAGRELPASLEEQNHP